MGRAWFWAALAMLPGCFVQARSDGRAYGGGTGGTPATTAGTGGDPLVIEDSCCVDGPEPPFHGPSWFAFAAPGPAPACPAPAAEGLTAYQEMKVEPHTCGACACSPAPCTLPAGVHTNAAKCADADGSFTVPLGPEPAGWTGACSDEGALPPDLQCDGVPCAQSVTVPELGVAPCEPTAGPTPPPPAPTWGRMARQCVIEPPASEGCEPDEVCPPPLPAGLSLCLYAEEDFPACPAAYPERTVFYRSVADGRGCEECSCAAPAGAECKAIFEVFSDGACGTFEGGIVVTDQLAACFDVVSGTALGSVEATPVTDVPGSCAPGGGAPFGEVAPADPVTLCCRSAPEPPG